MINIIVNVFIPFHVIKNPFIQVHSISLNYILPTSMHLKPQKFHPNDELGSDHTS